MLITRSLFNQDKVFERYFIPSGELNNVINVDNRLNNEKA